MVTLQKRYTATSDDASAGWAYFYIDVNKFVELFRVNVWCDLAPWKKVTIGVQDEDNRDYGLKDGYSLQNNALRWEAKTKFLEFISRIKLTIKDPVAAEVYLARANFIPVDARSRGHA
jgi:hypothetical protein